MEVLLGTGGVDCVDDIRVVLVNLDSICVGPSGGEGCGVFVHHLEVALRSVQVELCGGAVVLSSSGVQAERVGGVRRVIEVKNSVEARGVSVGADIETENIHREAVNGLIALGVGHSTQLSDRVSGEGLVSVRITVPVGGSDRGILGSVDELDQMRIVFGTFVPIVYILVVCRVAVAVTQALLQQFRLRNIQTTQVVCGGVCIQSDGNIFAAVGDQVHILADKPVRIDVPA
mmetsp:Transcript_8611/g.14309  ORF Transcript_8611/g.14309 Transcript_8611/m.14309 type:complete len:231 (+) Transcript_8611:623-1315(+)